MKLKLVGLLTITILTCSVQAQGYRQLVCANENEHDTHTWFSVSEGQPTNGRIVYNYSSATVSCPFHIRSILEEASILRCYGSWVSDSAPKAARAIIDNFAWVEVTNDGKNITAKTQTNRNYGSKKLNFKCRIKSAGER